MDWSDVDTTITLINSSVESQDRKKRKKVIDSLNAELSSDTKINPQFVTILTEIRKLLWPCLNDQSEAVRDSVLDLLKNIVNKLSEPYADELLPVVLHRLDGQEPSEEIRLKLVELLSIIVDRHQVNPFCEEIIQVLKICMEDKYQAVRQEAARCCIRLSENKGAVFHKNAVKLTMPIISCLKHKHAKTRILAIEALAAVLKEADWKNVNAQLVYGSLGETLFDGHFGVRLAVVELLGLWLSGFHDRYSFFSRMIPLILSCLSDEHPEVVSRAWTVWSDAGRQYVNENEDDLKDRMDFLDEKPAHYPEEVLRPNLGCRVLVQRNLVQITTPLLKELTDWKSEICVKASALLASVVLHSEAELTQHAETILLAMYGMAEQSKNVTPKFRENIEKTAEFMGYFIKPTTWHLLVFPLLEMDPTKGKLFILAALMRSTPKTQLSPYAGRLTKILAERDVCTTIIEDMQLEVLKCCRAFLDNIDELHQTDAETLSYCLFYVTAISSYQSDQKCLANAGSGCITLLASKMNVSVTDLLRQILKPLLVEIEENVSVWSTSHPDFRLLIYILETLENEWSTWDEETIMGILVTALDLQQGNVGVKSRVFETLTTIFNRPQSPDLRLTSKIVKKLIYFNLVWRPGISAERLRTVILVCLVSVYRRYQYLDCPELWHVVIGSARDEPRMNRKLVQECLGYEIRGVAKTKGLTADWLKTIYPKVVDRLDDVDDEVRNAAVTNIIALFSNLPKDMREDTHSGVLTYYVKTLIPYLDDDNASFRALIYDALQILGERAPKTVKSILGPKAPLFKLKELCSQLIDSLPSGSK